MARPKLTPARVALLGLVLVAGAAAKWWLPFVRVDRRVVISTPSPQALAKLSIVGLTAGQTACLDPVAFDPRGNVAVFQVGTFGRRDVPIEFLARAPGHRERIRARVPQDSVPLALRFDPPNRPTLGEVCVRNRSKKLVALIGTEEPRTLSRPVVRVDGREQPNIDVALQFHQARERSILQRLPEMVAAVAAYKPPPFGRPLLWLLLALVVLGLPVAVMVAFALGVRASER